MSDRRIQSLMQLLSNHHELVSLAIFALFVLIV